MKKIKKEIILNALDLFEKNEKQKAIDILYPYFAGECDEGELYDLLMETYIFITYGDLRKEGRDFGFENTEEIRKELDKLK